MRRPPGQRQPSGKIDRLVVTAGHDIVRASRDRADRVHLTRRTTGGERIAAPRCCSYTTVVKKVPAWRMMPSKWSCPCGTDVDATLGPPLRARPHVETTPPATPHADLGLLELVSQRGIEPFRGKCDRREWPSSHCVNVDRRPDVAQP